MSATLELAKKLIAQPSITPDDHDCQKLLIQVLEPLGFHCETIHSNGVTNLWARHGSTRPLVIMAGHTDVVPTGPLDKWSSDPFIPTERNGNLYGRGAADMKVPVAAMIIAAKEFIEKHPGYTGSIAFLITSDEEGPATDGTVLVCEKLRERGEQPDFCIVGEPSSMGKQGDIIKNGRRGSLSGRLTVKGIQGHIAYPDIAKNPIHLALPALTELAAEKWDDGNAWYDPTSWQISNIHAGTGAYNVIPGEILVDFNFRFSTEHTVESLQKRVHAILDRYPMEYELEWNLSGYPFLTPEGTLCQALSRAIMEETGVSPVLSTTGGTSDGRFIAQICPQVAEFGPLMTSIHQIDEHVPIADIEPLKNIYRRTLENLLLT
ncbi:succinyl-diaminopimelate desuccinylase [Oxalobacter sp. OttesenSCG-928-P03]|nr:succinyl-diaminopimelate desuccinylase [Oxalobacter sp. OttesenSCG-928-P03]